MRQLNYTHSIPKTAKANGKLVGKCLHQEACLYMHINRWTTKNIIPPLFGLIYRVARGKKVITMTQKQLILVDGVLDALSF